MFCVIPLDIVDDEIAMMMLLCFISISMFIMRFKFRTQTDVLCSDSQAFYVKDYLSK